MNAREINVMVKLGSTKTSIEPFGDNRFLIRTELIDHHEINKILPELLGSKLGIPPSRIEMVNGIEQNIKNFRIM